VGEVLVQPIVSAEDGLDIVLVRFSPGARTYLHTHDVPQVLHCTEGRGILATRHEQHLVEPGDVVYVDAGEEHWHAAAADSPFVHLSIRPPGDTSWTRVDPLG
jgi:quercetin dioxygenase-like cupin family protein